MLFRHSMLHAYKATMIDGLHLSFSAILRRQFAYLNGWWCEVENLCTMHDSVGEATKRRINNLWLCAKRSVAHSCIHCRFSCFQEKSRFSYELVSFHVVSSQILSHLSTPRWQQGRNRHMRPDPLSPLSIVFSNQVSRIFSEARTFPTWPPDTRYIYIQVFGG